MTWQQLKQAIEAKGIKNSDVIYWVDVFIDVDKPQPDIDSIEIETNDDGHISITNT